MKSHYLNIHHIVFKLFYLQILLTVFFCFAQKTSKEKEIDAQIKVGNAMTINFRTKELLAVSKDVLAKSEKINYQKGLANGYFFRASVFHNIGQYKESIKYLNTVQSYTEYLESDPSLSSRTYFLLGTNYSFLGLLTIAKKNILKAIDILEKANDHSLLVTQTAFYTSLSHVYDSMNMQDSVYYYLNKQRAILDRLDYQKVSLEKSYSDVNLGNYFYNMEKDDSARYFYQKANAALQGKNNIYEVGAVLGLANLDNEQNKLDDAISNYHYAVKFMKQNKFPTALSLAYEGLDQVYGKMGDHQKAQMYRALRQEINDSVAAATKMERDSVVTEIMKIEKEAAEKKSSEKFVKIASITGVFTVLIAIAAFYFIKRKRKELITEKESIIQEKENLIIQKDEETQGLKQKVNEAFEEVVQLAKDNNPEFLTRFQEIYPDFGKNLLIINPNLIASELRFCALLFFNFSTKDIAEYTFTSTKTVQNRKNSIRKKLNIASEEDLYVWFKNVF